MLFRSPTVEVDASAEVLATYISDFPIFPPETSWMREPKSNTPAITLKTASSGGKLIWFVADLDRCFGRDANPDHALIIANAVNYAIGDERKVELSSTHGVISAELYRQGGRKILHLNNRLLLSNVPGRQYDLVPIGPVTVRLRIEKAPAKIDLRVGGKTVEGKTDGNYVTFVVDAIADHEVVVVD